MSIMVMMQRGASNGSWWRRVWTSSARSSRSAALVTSRASADGAGVRGRIDHQRRQLALDVAVGKIGERAFLAAIRRLSEEEARVGDGGRSRRSFDAFKAMDFIRHFASS